MKIPYTLPEKSSFALVHKQMQRAIDTSVFPGGVLLVSVYGRIAFVNAYGVANLYSGIPAAIDTVYDLASMTKPLATALCVMKLIEKGGLALDRRLDAILKEFEHTRIGHIQIKDLLYHVSGLPAYHPYFKFLLKFPAASRKKKLDDMLLQSSPEHPVGSQTIYSDIGFMILRWVIEETAGIRLDQLADQEIYSPLALERLFFNDLSREPKRVSYAATENCSWRGEVLSGKVHDDNAYAVGGIDGQAGLFGNAHDIHLLLKELLLSYHGVSEKKVFVPELVKLFFERFNGKERALGFDSPSPSASSSGKYFSSDSVGHLGYTGTSFWMDLKKKIIIILLTNRVHPTRQNEKLKPFRPFLHDLVMEALMGRHLK
jgi:CubicO group peptidase (beta-lactamase class C family)